MKKIVAIVLLAFVAVYGAMLFWGSALWTSDSPPLQIIDDMDDQGKVKAQSASTFFADGKSMREPVEFTVPRNGKKYNVPFEEIDTKNVCDVPATDIVLARGKNRFNVLCAPCHNADGKGNGLVVQRGPFPNPPSLLENAKNYTDSKLFHIISAGQNIMPSYADKTSEVDRWAIVHYVRALQQGKITPAPITYGNAAK